MKFQHRFVDFMPSNIQEGVLYISLEYCSVIHKCACGCGSEVNTPLGTKDWKMTYNGETVTLKPSVGNWSFDCKSHYWITKNEIKWADKWNDERISSERENESFERSKYYKNKNLKEVVVSNPNLNIPNSQQKKNLFQKLVFWLKNNF